MEWSSESLVALKYRVKKIMNVYSKRVEFIMDYYRRRREKDKESRSVHNGPLQTAERKRYGVIK